MTITNTLMVAALVVALTSCVKVPKKAEGLGGWRSSRLSLEERANLIARIVREGDDEEQVRSLFGQPTTVIHGYGFSVGGLTDSGEQPRSAKHDGEYLDRDAFIYEFTDGSIRLEFDASSTILDWRQRPLVEASRWTATDALPIPLRTW